MIEMGSGTQSEMDPLTGGIIGGLIEVHRHLGAGLLESSYAKAVGYELRNRHYDVELEVPVNVYYKGLNLGYSYRLDLLINGMVIIELKTVEFLHEVHQAQTLTYLKFGRIQYPQISRALLVNFNAKVLKGNIQRFI
jgi:GxxExxY protein